MKTLPQLLESGTPSEQALARATARNPSAAPSLSWKLTQYAAGAALAGSIFGYSVYAFAAEPAAFIPAAFIGFYSGAGSIMAGRGLCQGIKALRTSPEADTAFYLYQGRFTCSPTAAERAYGQRVFPIDSKDALLEVIEPGVGFIGDACLQDYTAEEYECGRAVGSDYHAYALDSCSRTYTRGSITVATERDTFGITYNLLKEKAVEMLNTLQKEKKASLLADLVEENVANPRSIYSASGEKVWSAA